MNMLSSTFQFSACLQKNGYVLVDHVLPESSLDELIDAIESVRMASSSASAPGLRQLLRCPAVRKVAESPQIVELVETVLGANPRVVRAILFDKTPASNWYVTWHQDLSIPLKQRLDLPGFGPWSIKEGIIHVQPPAAILEQMLSVRVHLDDCLSDNGPIKFIPGSHKAGILNPVNIAAWKERHEPVLCAARRGDAILMRPLVLHSSSKSDSPQQRRVLHLEYANANLPDELQWAEG